MQNFPAFIDYDEFPRGVTPTDIDLVFNDYERGRNLLTELKPWDFGKLTRGQRLTLQTFVEQGNWVFIVKDPYSNEYIDYIDSDTTIKVTPLPSLISSWEYREMTVASYKDIVHDFYDGGAYDNYLDQWGYTL